MYAILDIETTGGKYNEEGVTEIAIYRHNGFKVEDQFISLVNPEQEIQPYVQKLTGINNKMLRNAPRFFEIAKRIIEITKDCIIVAHNADFDYRILRKEFESLGYNFKKDSICTVTLSKHLLPEMESYKLGNLVRSLGIPLTNRHRAQGDAFATVKLFELLLEKDSSKAILKSQIKALNGKQVSSKYLKIIEDLPNCSGIYYLHNKAGEIIYIGKSNNIQKRVRNHLTGKNRKALKIQKSLHKINFEITGSELIALLKEQNEIKKNRPRINKEGRYRLYPMGIRIDINTDYHQLVLEQVRKDREYITVFKNGRVAKHILNQWIASNKLCRNHSSLEETNVSCVSLNQNECKESCIGKEKKIEYNKRVAKLADQSSYPYDNFLMIGKGRKDGESSFIYIENQVYMGYGYFELNYQINTSEKILSRITEMQDNSDCQALILSFIKREKYSKLIPLKNTNDITIN